jgi:hypothetical protein
MGYAGRVWGNGGPIFSSTLSWERMRYGGGRRLTSRYLKSPESNPKTKNRPPFILVRRMEWVRSIGPVRPQDCYRIQSGQGEGWLLPTGRSFHRSNLTYEIIVNGEREVVLALFSFRLVVDGWWIAAAATGCCCAISERRGGGENETCPPHNTKQHQHEN